MNKGDTFPVAGGAIMSDRELRDIGVLSGMSRGNIRARWTGEKRKPRKGEWYLSGAVVEAYKAPNDLSTEFHIAKLVLCEQIWRVVQ